jgi:hypothetical protein
MEWHHKQFPPTKEFNTELSNDNITENLFWYSDFLPHGVIINAQYYSILLHNDVHQVVARDDLGNCKRKLSYCTATLVHISKFDKGDTGNNG